ncbi:hypothetical protein GCM10011363_29830 [Marivita lacus]|uniref:Uncharacterized protein n=2 Tax=Marivita lacus TaxID=1323742 RepID=A0ABQ1KX78_9RHOB|nr:hypothetical protein GCM10011363_29830 [Marivita lacus]
MGTLMTVLAFGTLGFVTVFAYIAARATEKLKEDPSHKRSTLCARSNHWAKAQKQG